MISSSEHAYVQLRRAIMQAELLPGQVVSQVKLAAELNISRTPLREALRRLQTEGLLDGDFNRRVRVAPLSVDELEHIAAVRVSLESLGVRVSVPQLDERDLEILADALARIDRAMGDTAVTFDEFQVSHRVFHTTLFSRSGTRMQDQLAELWDHAQRYRACYRITGDRSALADIAHDDHAAILEAARRRDGPRCGQLIAVHLARTALTTLAMLDATYDPRAVREALRVAAPPAG